MTRETLIGMLRQGNNGSQILSILNSITDGMSISDSTQVDAYSTTASAATDQPIEF